MWGRTGGGGGGGAFEKNGRGRGSDGRRGQIIRILGDGRLLNPGGNIKLERVSFTSMGNRNTTNLHHIKKHSSGENKTNLNV